MNNAQSFPAVANGAKGRYRLSFTANSVNDLGRSTIVRRSSAHTRIAGAFFVPAISCNGGLRGDTFGCAGCLTSRSANPAQSATQTCLAARGGSSSTLGATPMHALIPSVDRLRAAAHRAMAIAALHADSSLSTRLNRYRHHMDRARALLALEVAL